MDVIVSKAGLLTKIISTDKQDTFLKLVILTCAAILGIIHYHILIQNYHKYLIMFIFV